MTWRRREGGRGGGHAISSFSPPPPWNTGAARSTAGRKSRGREGRGLCYAMHTLSRRPTGDPQTSRPLALRFLRRWNIISLSMGRGQWTPSRKRRLRNRFNEAAERNRVCRASGEGGEGTREHGTGTVTKEGAAAARAADDGGVGLFPSGRKIECQEWGNTETCSVSECGTAVQIYLYVHYV